MSFLVDPPLLYAAGEAYARVLPESLQGREAGTAGALIVGSFVAVSAACWLERPETQPLWRAFGAGSGREFMVGNGLFRWRRARRAGPREHALAALAFATYPLWFRLGWDHGRRMRP
jgi:hypothetical protein